MSKDRTKAFTHIFPPDASELTSSMIVGHPYERDTGVEPADNRRERVVAVWDTGATSTSISIELAQRLGLQPEAFTALVSVLGPGSAPLYRISLVIPQYDIVFPSVSVCGIAFAGSDAELLIGMDFIRMCDFAVSSPKNDIVFSVRFPSEEHIDFRHRMPQKKASNGFLQSRKKK